MEEIFQAILQINNESVELNPFIENLLARTVVGAVSSLKGTEDVQSLECRLTQGDLALIVNGSEILLTSFPREIITNTIIGLVSSLKGVAKIDSLKINVKAQ